MLKESLSTLTRTAFAAVVLAAAASTASATPVFTPFGDPFPAGSLIIVGSGFQPGIGSTPYSIIYNIQLQSIDTTGGNQAFVYTAENYAPLHLDTLGDQIVIGSIPDLTVTVYGRAGLFETGTFDLVLGGSFSEAVMYPSGDHITSKLNPDLVSAGTVTFTGPVTVGGLPGLLAESSFTINTMASFNGGPFIILPPQDATTSPNNPFAVPEPATAALVIPGLLALLGVRRRRGS
ncbi:MAG: hypothetical protein U1F76_24735 [Candidatus Competibacteraceae bacterium]